MVDAMLVFWVALFGGPFVVICGDPTWERDLLCALRGAS